MISGLRIRLLLAFAAIFLLLTTRSCGSMIAYSPTRIGKQLSSFELIRSSLSVVSIARCGSGGSEFAMTYWFCILSELCCFLC